MSRIEINESWCKHCYICVSVCPRNVLAIDEARLVRGFRPVVVQDEARCTACHNCELLCPDLAIEVVEAEEE